MPGEALPQVSEPRNPSELTIGGGWIAAVYGPDGTLLSYGCGTE